jgi:two-component system NarL family sensor kinase
MKLRQKVIFLAIAPLMLVLCVIALFVRHQAVTLAQQQRETIQQAYLEQGGRAQTLRGAGLARHRPPHDSGRKDKATLDEAKRILASLSFGNDGYFFVYDLGAIT